MFLMPNMVRIGMVAVLGVMVSCSVVAQSIYDPVGDISAGDPAYLDLNRIRVRQSSEKLQVDYYPVASIPGGNQAGISATCVFEFYIDTDSNAATGMRLDDIGYDYMLRADLYQWNGKSWIDGNVYWGFDQTGNWKESDGYFISSSWLISQRFRWEFSLISLKWARIDWVARLYFRDHWAERVPDTSHATLYIDTTLVPDLVTTETEYIRIIYPDTYQAVLDSFDVLHTVDAGARVESALCGTDFDTKPLTVTYSPWLNGVAYSGNPVKMGSWNWGNTPAWFMLFHELGHNFTLAANRFCSLYPGGGYVSAGGDDWHFGTNFCEAWATMVGLYAVHELTTSPAMYGITPGARDDLAQQFAQTRKSFQDALRAYEVIPDHSRLYPDVVDGIFLCLADSLGYGIIPRWYKILRPPDAPWARLDGIDPSTDYDGAKITAMTITASAFSAAAGVDLRDLFKTRWDFPIDNNLYAQVTPEITAMVNSSAEVGNAASGAPLVFRLLGNFPNPFNGTTTVCFELPERTPVMITIYNTLGQIVQRQSVGVLPPGEHAVTCEADGLTSGVYFYVLSTVLGSATNKMLLVR
ncbi:MAG: T9SS type A sorting domain-containing protein [Bacteroidetes bacterium]|nr:T9SS type A sorting domain-containing protein [Bacteroidota bacterium]